MNDQSFDSEDLARRVNDSIRAAIGDDHIWAVAEKTGLDPDRIVEIVGGDLPDSFELISLELGYHRPIWPPNSDEPD
ncbi:hypothetical protein ABCS02_27915 [Microbacterium sp. X-17]|uniref:hypothetical protein n=1 Tax=Microbacterium sp. X-17 TaxID=3144404 RepID=UPI0031F533A8